MNDTGWQPAEVIGLAGVLSGAAVAIAGYWWSSQVARANRLFTVRSEAYREALKWMHGRQRSIESVHPVIGEHVEMPQPDPEELNHINALVGVFGSDEIANSVKEYGDLVFAFRYEASTYGTLTRQARRELPERRDRMDGARDKARENLLRAEKRMRAELAK